MFIPAVAMIVVFDTLFWLNVGRIRDRLEGWRKRGVKFGVSVVATTWIWFAFLNAHRWGVSEEGLRTVEGTFNVFQAVPVLSQLPPILFILVVAFIILYVALS